MIHLTPTQIQLVVKLRDEKLFVRHTVVSHYGVDIFFSLVDEDDNEVDNLKQGVGKTLEALRKKGVLKYEEKISPNMYTEVAEYWLNKDEHGRFIEELGKIKEFKLEEK